MPRYVILQHDWNGIHYDLMLEQGDVLKTWRLAAPIQPGSQMAIVLPDHRLDYLTYEGPVSRDRGIVTRVAEGTYEAVSATDLCWKMVMQGTLQGSMALQLESDDRWHLEWRPLL